MTDAELIARHDARLPRYTSYPTAPHFGPGVDGGAYLGWIEALPADLPLSLYLHVPFCERLCRYCGCATTVVRRDGPKRAYAALLAQELRMVAARLHGRRRVTQIHWGGGTPTSLPADCLTDLAALLRELFELAAGAEIAVELDPANLPEDRVAALAAMGVTRASLGVQDLDPAVQQAIGRVQSEAETARCAERMRAIGAGSLNLDLIYGLPGQDTAGAARTAARILALDADRIAVFGYAHVPWMRRHQALIPAASLPGPAERFAQAQAIGRVLRGAGYLPIGMDHYARASDALTRAAAAGRLRRNFQGYTADDAPVLLGFGASAIGRLPQGYVQNAPAVPAYGQAIGTGRLATVRGAALTAQDRLRGAVIEAVMCGLDVDLAAIAAAHAADPAPLLDCAAALGPLVADGLVRREGARIVVTERGRPFLRSVAARFDAYLGPAPGAAAGLRHCAVV